MNWFIFSGLYGLGFSLSMLGMIYHNPSDWRNESPSDKLVLIWIMFFSWWVVMPIAATMTLMDWFRNKKFNREFEKFDTEFEWMEEPVVPKKKEIKMTIRRKVPKNG